MIPHSALCYSYLIITLPCTIFFKSLPEDMFTDSKEEEGRERNIHQLPPEHTQLRIKPVTQAYALTGIKPTTPW